MPNDCVFIYLKDIVLSLDTMNNMSLPIVIIERNCYNGSKQIDEMLKRNNISRANFHSNTCGIEAQDAGQKRIMFTKTVVSRL